MQFLILLAQLAVFAVNMNRYVACHHSSEEAFPLLYHKNMYIFNTINTQHKLCMYKYFLSEWSIEVFLNN